MDWKKEETINSRMKERGKQLLMTGKRKKRVEIFHELPVKNYFRYNGWVGWIEELELYGKRVVGGVRNRRQGIQK